MKKRLTAFLLAAVVSAGICSMQAVIGPAPGPGALETVTVQAAAQPSASKLAAAIKKAYGEKLLAELPAGQRRNQKQIRRGIFAVCVCLCGSADDQRTS